ncbi:glycosyltransferase [Jannaschia sp. R86511]|uniref:glycosyltransferase n=1 Tax=Jannaschia sp. R86511 TaxID=3093853 RepID=UPI0036D2518D
MSLLDTRGPVREVALPGPRRVLLGADTFAPDVNGAARFAERLALGLAGRGHDVHVVSPSTDGRSGRETMGAVTVHRVASVRTPVHPTFRVARPWRVAGDARRLLADVAPDVVHPQSHFPVSRSLAAAAGEAGVPLVMTNHFMPENLFGHARVPAALRRAAARWAWRDLARVFAQAQVVTAPTPRAVELLAASGGVLGARAVSCGIDLAGYGRDLPATGARDGADATPVVLFVGRLDEEKRVGQLLRAVAALPPELPVRLDVVGDGTCRREWEQLAVDLRLGSRARFLGRVDEDVLRHAYASATVFCMPGVAELQSLATLEAMASGAAVVAADAMALPHLVEEGANGWLFPPGDVAALADRLLRVLADREGARRMGEHSRRLAAGHDIETTLDAFEAVYAEAEGLRALHGGRRRLH